MAKYKRNIMNEKYEFIKELGEGGNAMVDLVIDKKDGKNVALKKLYSMGEEKKARFKDEINVMKKNCNRIKGIIPIIESNDEEFWYTMPVAEPLNNFINKNNLNFNETLKLCVELSSILKDLHKNKIYHRDIKPSNLYFYKEQCYFGDFGLVEFPESPYSFTKSDKGLGAIFTIAPEMKRNPKEADASKADVYSLAKTIWMVLTKDEKGFDGVYNYLDKTHSLRFNSKFRGVHLVELEELLTGATQNAPEDRPNIIEFTNKLKEYSEILVDEQKIQESEWRFINSVLFSGRETVTSCWDDTNVIVDVLNIIGSHPVYNHMLFTGGGGLDLGRAEKYVEEGWIKIEDSTIGFNYIAKPQKLYFEGFNSNYQWNYFLLEFDDVEPVIKRNHGIEYELLLEDNPGHFISSENEVYGVLDYDTGEKLPENYEHVKRFYSGKLLIVMKWGPYNSISATYDGRHGMCSEELFRIYIEQLIIKEEFAKENGIDSYQFLNMQEISSNPFQSKSEKEKHEMDRKCRKYVKQHFQEWYFEPAVNDTSFNGNTKYCFEFNLGSYSPEKYLLCTDGYFRISKNIEEEVMYVYDKNMAVDMYLKIKNMLVEYWENEGYSCFTDNKWLKVHITKMKTPNHIFNEQEILKQMKQADDRYDNFLVVDENGYIKIVNDFESQQFYPVQYPGWCRQEKLVGKYSDLSTVHTVYVNTLKAWYEYLTKSQEIDTIFIEDSCNINEDEILKEINKIFLSTKSDGSIRSEDIN